MVNLYSELYYKLSDCIHIDIAMQRRKVELYYTVINKFIDYVS